MTTPTPKPLYYATISYRTPARRRVIYSGVIAANTLERCKEKLIECLKAEETYGRRRIAEILDDFVPLSLGKQIATR